MKIMNGEKKKVLLVHKPVCNFINLGISYLKYCFHILSDDGILHPDSCSALTLLQWKNKHIFFNYFYSIFINLY